MNFEYGMMFVGLMCVVVILFAIIYLLENER